MSKDRVGFKRLPDDANIEDWLNKLFLEYRAEMDQFGIELVETIQQTNKDEEPRIFAFAKMLNKLATMDKPQLIKILSAVMWEGLGEDGT